MIRMHREVNGLMQQDKSWKVVVFYFNTWNKLLEKGKKRCLKMSYAIFFVVVCILGNGD